jgi:AcrR family transcriptional regulator
VRGFAGAPPQPEGANVMTRARNAEAPKRKSGASHRKLTRAERTIQTREKLLRAAARVVGEEGYANAVVSRITTEADTAQGTFYNYFSSQQDLFDQLLPNMGGELLGFIRARTVGIHDPVERERQGFLAFFEFLKQRPEFYRILYEAEVFAPQAYQRHMNIISSSYVRLLERAFDKGELSVSSKAHLEPIAFSLMAARQYLCMQYARRNGKISDPPEWVVDAYMALVSNGLFGKKQ